MSSNIRYREQKYNSLTAEKIESIKIFSPKLSWMVISKHTHNTSFPYLILFKHFFSLCNYNLHQLSIFTPTSPFLLICIIAQEILLFAGR